jgi:CheY-like chemotaxis protein
MTLGKLSLCSRKRLVGGAACLTEIKERKLIAMRYKILVVDDEPANLRLLERLFAGEYDVVTATSGGEGLELLALHEFAVIISDQRMPSMTGVEFLKRAADMRSQTVRIILSGHTDVDDLVITRLSETSFD